MPIRNFSVAALAIVAGVALAQSSTFEVATVKPPPPGWDGGAYITMKSANRFEVKNHSVKLLIAAAYSLNPKAISGGPEWMETDRYDIVAKTPGETRPDLDVQMAMLRALLGDRFNLAFHREEKDLAIYALTVAKNGPKLKESTAAPTEPLPLTARVFPDHVSLPGRNSTVQQLAWVMQRAIVDRPVVDRTGLSGHYDFDLEWTADDTQFGGIIRGTPSQPVRPDLFAALQEELGLRLEATRGPVETLVVDRLERPEAN